MKVFCSFALTILLSQFGFAAEPTSPSEPLPTAEKIHNPEEGSGAISHHGATAEKGEHRDNAALFPPHHSEAGKATPPPAVKLLEPAFQAKVGAPETALTWEAAPGATAYHVQVATDPNFKWLLSDEHFVTGTKFQAKGLEKGKTYYWRVAPWKDGNLAATNKGPFSNSIFEIQ